MDVYGQSKYNLVGECISSNYKILSIPVYEKLNNKILRNMKIKAFPENKNRLELDKEDMVHIYNGILLIHKKEQNNFAATWMDLEIAILSEVSQTEKDKYHMISLICVI